jgi:DNA-binding MarR family transcriptional regulator
MSSDPLNRAVLLDEIVFTLGKDLSTRTILFHTAIAEKLGLNPTDHKALDLMIREGSVTAGRLAELTGLTTGAVTGMIDRLEKAGFVQRTRPAHDRRQVIIQPIPEKIQKIHHLFESLGQAILTMTDQFSERELAIIHSYLTQSIRVLQTETAKLQSDPSIPNES